MTQVPPPAGLSTVRLPPSASTRSARPLNPEPSAGIGAADAVVRDRDDSSAVLARDADVHLASRSAYLITFASASAIT